MEALKINNYNVEVNYYEELEPYFDRFERSRFRGEKLQACSPFRQEHNPSFAVNLENGSWIDSGADSEADRKGSFISLLAFFRGEAQEDTANYLLEKYLHILDDTEGLKLDLNLQMEAPEVSVLGQDKYSDVIGKPSEYLSGRGISEQVQKYFETGIGRKGNCVAIPWHDVRGRIINIKYRSIKEKKFWYTKGGQPVKNHVYGLWAVKEQKAKEVYLTESEIDTLYLWSNGFPAIAVGGASINDKQINLILNSGIEHLIIATDSDVVGERFAKHLFNIFGGMIQVSRLQMLKGKKDINDHNSQELRIISKQKRSYKLFTGD